MYLNVNLEGRLVNDPEYKTGKNDREFVTFRMVVNQYFGGQETSTFLSCTGGDGIAQRMKNVELKKGRMLHLNGDLTERHYTDREGKDRTSLDLSIANWHFVGIKEKTDEEKTAPAATSAPKASGTLHAPVNVNSDDDLPL